MTTKLFILLILGFVFFSCKKDKKTSLDQLPSATQTGENTFGCLINGEVYTPKGTVTKPRLYTQDDNGEIYFIRAVNVDSDVYIYIKSDSIKINKIGNYPLLSTTGKNFFGKYINLKSYCDMATDSTNSGMLTITKYSTDSQKRIISGTFYFTVKTSGCPDINVTDGRFDISF